jgi:hypothetical protein
MTAWNHFQFLSAAFVALNLIMLSLIGSPANAHADCEIYGRYSALQLRTNLDDQCKFSGHLWEGSFKELVAWCKDVQYDEARKALKARHDALAQCAKTKR